MTNILGQIDSVDVVQENDRRYLLIEGWALHEAQPLESIFFGFGPDDLYRANSKFRSDIRDQFPDISHASASGFLVRIEIGENQCESKTLRMTAVLASGEILISEIDVGSIKFGSSREVSNSVNESSQENPGLLDFNEPSVSKVNRSSQRKVDGRILPSISILSCESILFSRTASEEFDALSGVERILIDNGGSEISALSIGPERVIVMPDRVSPNKAYNSACRYATGEIVVLLNDYDLPIERHLSEIREAFSSDRSLGVLHFLRASDSKDSPQGYYSSVAIRADLYRRGGGLSDSSSDRPALRFFNNPVDFSTRSIELNARSDYEVISKIVDSAMGVERLSTQIEIERSRPPKEDLVFVVELTSVCSTPCWDSRILGLIKQAQGEVSRLVLILKGDRRTVSNFAGLMPDGAVIVELDSYDQLTTELSKYRESARAVIVCGERFADLIKADIEFYPSSYRDTRVVVDLDSFSEICDSLLFRRQLSVAQIELMSIFSVAFSGSSDLLRGISAQIGDIQTCLLVPSVELKESFIIAARERSSGVISGVPASIESDLLESILASGDGIVTALAGGDVRARDSVAYIGSVTEGSRLVSYRFNLRVLSNERGIAQGLAHSKFFVNLSNVGQGYPIRALEACAHGAVAIMSGRDARYLGLRSGDEVLTFSSMSEIPGLISSVKGDDSRLDLMRECVAERILKEFSQARSQDSIIALLSTVLSPAPIFSETSTTVGSRSNNLR